MQSLRQDVTGIEEEYQFSPSVRPEREREREGGGFLYLLLRSGSSTPPEVLSHVQAKRNRGGLELSRLHKATDSQIQERLSIFSFLKK